MMFMEDFLIENRQTSNKDELVRWRIVFAGLILKEMVIDKTGDLLS